jgi:uncharacterized protein (TIGR02099 family)
MFKFPFRITTTLKRLRRIAVAVMLLIFFAGTGLFLGLRYSVLPDIERYHNDINSAVSRAIGLAIEFDKIEADWYGVSPHLRLTGIRILDKNRRTTLELQRVDAVVSWMTLLTAELRLASLEIDQPDLMVKRDVQGVLQISGIPLEGQSSDNSFSNMLLNQSRIVVRDAHIAWLDEQQAKPLLVFDRVNLIIENGWRRHRFAMRAIPPKELSSQLDVRGNFSGNSFDDLQGWKGELFTQLDYVNLPAWKTWLPLPEALRQGKGALRGWLGVEQGKINRITADLGLENVQTRLAPDLPPLDIRVLSGRLGWHDISHGFELSSQNLALKLFDNFELKPTDIFFSLSDAHDLKFSSGEMKANLLELNGLIKLLEFLPLERQIKEQFAEFSPQGKVSNLQAKWEIDAEKLLHYRIKARFAELALQRVGKMPGFSGLSGELDGNENSGTLTVNARNFSFDAPQIMPEHLTLDTVSIQSNWHRNGDGVEINVHNVAISNADLTGTAYGSFQTLAGSPGKIDLNVHLNRASLLHVGKYIPLVALGTETRNWLNNALLAGQSSDVNVRLKGNMNDFPFVDNRKGIFKVQVRAKGVGLEYAQDWPRIDNANVVFSLHGNEMEVTASSASTAGVNLKNVKVSIADILSRDLMLSINGEAEAGNERGLAYVNASPVHGYLGGFTDHIVASGKGKLNLKLDIPLRDTQSTRVAGTYHFTDGDVEFYKILPTLRKVNGDLYFTESAVSTNNIVAQIMGGPAKLAIETGADGAINVKLGGRANFGVLGQINPNPLLRKLRGDMAWNVDIGVKNSQSKILFTTSLAGVQSDLPAPLFKRADDTLPVRFEMTDTSAERKAISVQIGSLLNANLIQTKGKNGVWIVKRGMVNFGNVPQKADKDGLWVIGTLPQVALDGWEGLPATDGESPPLNIAGTDLVIQKLTGYGYILNDLHIKANSRNGVLMAQLASKDANGDLVWRSADNEAGENGRLVAKFKNLNLVTVDVDLATKEKTESITQTKTTARVDLPEIDLNIDKLSFKGRQLGKLELLAQQNEDIYQLEHLRLSNSDGTLAIDGKWVMSEDAPQTQLNLKFDIANAGNILARSGYPNSVKNGSGKLESTFTWADTPMMFGKDKLNGTLSLDTSKGQFLQIDPGIGKLLSILSLQALPKRITLDFEDVFSKGFEFDSINGSAEIKQGVMVTDNLKIEGSSAKVSMKGQIDLVNETQNLRVRIVPAVGNSAALISWLVATPAVGASVFLTSKLLGDPLGQLAAFEYSVTGSWIDPVVEDIGKKKPVK